MKKLVFKLNNTSLSNEGTKTEALRQLEKLGVSIPPFWSIGIDTYNEFISVHHIPSICEFLSKDEFDASIEQKILGLLGQVEVMLPSDLPQSLIVRSSSASKGTQEHYASIVSGAFESYEASPDTLADAILKVYASAYSERAFFQLKHNNAFDKIDGMAIIVQEFITPKCSGVVHFYANRDYMDVVWMLGHLRAIVSGQIEGNQDRLYKNSLGEVIVDGNETHIYTLLTNDLCRAFEQIYQNCEILGNALKANLEIEWLFDGSSVKIVQCQELIVL